MSLPPTPRPGFMCPFILEGNTELIRLAYESGLGETNAMGFGVMEWWQVRM
jgi:CRISPR-associated endoribonuclease Cas6